MRYNKFTIKNFKGIATLEIDLSHNRIITLVGLNESGKTTIMEAMKLFYDLSTGKKLSEKDIQNIRPKGIDFTGEISLEAVIDYEKEDLQKIEKYWKERSKDYQITLPDTAFTYQHKFIFELHSFKEHKRTATLHVKVKNIVSADPSKKVSTLHEYENEEWNALLNFIKSKLVPEVLFYEDFIFDIPDEISFSSGTTNSDNDVSMTWQLVLDDILKSVNPKFNSFQEYVVQIWDSDNETALNRISQIEEVLNKKITTSWKELFQKGSKKLNFKEIKLNCKGDAQNLQVSFKVKTDSGKLFSINDRSKGCKWFFSFLIFTEFRKNRSRNILFLLDEPASNLHSSAQQKILEAIKELSSNSMVVYSTHSHHLINPKWLSGAYVVINDKLTDSILRGDMTFDESTKIVAKKYFKYVGDGHGSTKISYFQPILDALDYKPSAVEPIPNIIITEGKFDWYAFKYFIDTVMKHKKYSFNLYPGAGRDQLYDIIRLYLAWGKQFIVLLDGDMAGQNSKKKYLKEFGDLVKANIVTLKDILGLDIALEGLFEDDDKEQIINDVFGKGSYVNILGDSQKIKEKLNLAINHLAYNKKKIEMSEKTLSNFSKIFEFLKKEV